jgi:ribosomal protein S18 acetylase RimI-like enzyme
VTYAIPSMTPIFDANCALVGWFDGTHVFDANVEWIAFHSKGNVYASAPSGEWLGALHDGSFLDRHERPVAWLAGTSPHGGLMPASPRRAMRPLPPKRPLRPRTPLFPAKPMTPSCGWSRLTWLEWTGRAPAPRAAGEIAIEVLDPQRFDEFFRYLDDHLRDNGRDGMYFQPLSTRDSGLPAGKAQAFIDGLKVDVAASGWRRAWIARDERGGIAGHVDLRGHSERFADHRCVVGLGVHRDQRRRGVARKLLAHAEQWAAAQPMLQWIDLRVLAINEPAVALYRAAGFDMNGGTRDRFVIDGKSIGEMSMARKIPR